MKRDFKASKPNEKWVTDVTEVHLFGEKLYLSPILDLFNGEIISYNIEKRPTFLLVERMLDKALTRLDKGITLSFIQIKGGTIKWIDTNIF